MAYIACVVSAVPCWQAEPVKSRCMPSVWCPPTLWSPWPSTYETCNPSAAAMKHSYHRHNLRNYPATIQCTYCFHAPNSTDALHVWVHVSACCRCGSMLDE
jgi:hypothetical protein